MKWRYGHAEIRTRVVVICGLTNLRRPKDKLELDMKVHNVKVYHCRIVMRHGAPCHRLRILGELLKMKNCSPGQQQSGSQPHREFIGSSEGQGYWQGSGRRQRSGGRYEKSSGYTNYQLTIPEVGWKYALFLFSLVFVVVFFRLL